MSGAGDLEIKFKTVCEACGSLGIRITHPERAPESTVVECARCGGPRGTLGALRQMARTGINQQSEF